MPWLWPASLGEEGGKDLQQASSLLRSSEVLPLLWGRSHKMGYLHPLDSEEAGRLSWLLEMEDSLHEEEAAGGEAIGGHWVVILNVTETSGEGYGKVCCKG